MNAWESRHPSSERSPTEPVSSPPPGTEEILFDSWSDEESGGELPPSENADSVPTEDAEGPMEFASVEENGTGEPAIEFAVVDEAVFPEQPELPESDSDWPNEESMGLAIPAENSPAFGGARSFDEPVLLELYEPDIDIPTTRERINSLAGTFVSVLLHVWLIAMLARVTMTAIRVDDEPPIESRLVETAETPKEEEEEKFVLANPDDRELEVREVLNATSQGVQKSREQKMLEAPKLLSEVDPKLREKKMFDIPEGTLINEEVVVKGSVGDSIVQMESALDRVTWEISQTMKENKVLVIWLIDSSGSLEKQRQIIAKRLKRIYGELGALEKVGQIPRVDQALLSGVVAYGESTKFLTKEPTERYEVIQDAIAGIKHDPSGRENVFTAASQAMHMWGKYRASQNRRIMLIVVTDESGDDFDQHELAIARCKYFGAKAYVIGPSAVFGRREGYVPYVAEEDGKTYQIPVDIGPETARFENVSLPFWFEGPQLTYLSSGFGPYGLSRLVKETGGVYFTTNMTTMEGLTPFGSFDADLLKPFEPDYRFGVQAAYERDISLHPLRRALSVAANFSMENRVEGTPQLELRVTPNNFRQIATSAQQTVARSGLAIDTILSAFPPGIEKLVDKEPSPRWRMQFCLSYGRLLAIKVRALEYNHACAAIKSDLTPQEVGASANHLIFRPSEKINYATNLKRQADLSKLLLERVMKEAPGTPFAALAERELRHPLGIRIVKRFIPPPPMRRAQEGPRRRGIQLANDAQRRQPQKPAPRPAPPKLPKL